MTTIRDRIIEFRRVRAGDLEAHPQNFRTHPSHQSDALRDGAQVLVNLGLVHRGGEWVAYWDAWLEWMAASGWRRFGWYVWDQGHGIPGDWNGRLAPSHEFIFHLNRTSQRPQKWVEKKPGSIQVRKHGDSTMRAKDGTLRAFTNPGASAQPTKVPDSVVRVNRTSGGVKGHPAPFPVALAEFVFRTWPGVAFDPFCGSGSAVIAAERLRLPLHGIDIVPAYVDVSVRRWQDYTGRDATLEATGQTFAEVAVKRIQGVK